MADEITTPADPTAPKPFYWSKTFWTNLIMAIIPAIPYANDYVMAHPDIFMSFFAVINIGLRFLSKTPITIN